MHIPTEGQKGHQAQPMKSNTPAVPRYEFTILLIISVNKNTPFKAFSHKALHKLDHFNVPYSNQLKAASISK